MRTGHWEEGIHGRPKLKMQNPKPLAMVKKYFFFCIFKNLTFFVLLIINIMLLLTIFQHILTSVPIGINQCIWTLESRGQIR